MTMGKLMGALAVATVTLGMTAPAAAEQVNISTTGFTPTTGTAGNSVAFSGTSNGVTVNVLASGWTATQTDTGGYTFAPSYMSRGILGLGVTSPDDSITNDGSRFHLIDNKDGFDFVLFQFDQNVTITSAILNQSSLLNGKIDNESSAGIGLSNLSWDTRLDLSDASLFDSLSIEFFDVDRFFPQNDPTVRPDVPFNLGGQFGNIWMIGANLNNDDTVTFGNGTSPSYDAFNIQRLTVNTAGAVPEPASWALMIVGFALVGGGLRRRKADVTIRYA